MLVRHSPSKYGTISSMLLVTGWHADSALTSIGHRNINEHLINEQQWGVNPMTSTHYIHLTQECCSTTLAQAADKAQSYPTLSTDVAVLMGHVPHHVVDGWDNHKCFLKVREYNIIKSKLLLNTIGDGAASKRHAREVASHLVLGGFLCLYELYHS